MKALFTGKILPFVFALTVLMLWSCEEDAVPPADTNNLQIVSSGFALGAGVKIELRTESSVASGYNELQMFLTDSISGDRITDVHIHLHVMDPGMESCPVIAPEQPIGDAFPCAVVLPALPDAYTTSVMVSIHNHKNGKYGTAKLPLSVSPLPGSNVARFTAESGNEYVFALQLKETARTGLNDFTVVALRDDGEGFTPTDDLSFSLSTKMVQMNHGSPNNVSPVLEDGGKYEGKVNFTMSGEWLVLLSVSGASGELGSMEFEVVVN